MRQYALVAGGDSGGESEPDWVALDSARAEQGDPVAMIRVGYRLRANDPGAELGWYERAAKLGHTTAMFNCGVLLRDSDPEAAEMWWRKAAAAGDQNGMMALARLLEGSDEAQAMGWYEKAADLGSVPAMYGLGRLYWKRDRQLSRRWMRAGANAGDRRSMYYLAVLLDPFHWSTVWRGPRGREARRWLEEAARLGDSAAQSRLGDQLLFWHRSGLGMKEERFALARGWLEQAAEAGNVRAMEVLGSALSCRDPAAGLQWHRKGARLGSTSSAVGMAAAVLVVDSTESVKTLEDALRSTSSRRARLTLYPPLIAARLAARLADRKRRRKRHLVGDCDAADNGSSAQDRVADASSSISGPARIVPELLLKAADPVVGCVQIGWSVLTWVWRSPSIRRLPDRPPIR